ncbi:MAG: hypothetical protein ACI4WF_02800 [Bacilli bacterium]
MEENKNLKLEIEVLKKRVTALENKERRRKILGLIKVIIMVVLIAFVALKLYEYYQKKIDLSNSFNFF